MPWLKIELQADNDAIDVVSEMLSAYGAMAISIEDAADHTLFDDPRQRTMFWPSSRVSGLFDADTDAATVIQRIRERLGETLPSQVEAIADQQWETLWRQHSRPMVFGNRLWVCPSGVAAPRPSAISMTIDPGLAFGTGAHPATALCLEWLAEQTLTGKTVLDYGCGSGILAIAALKMGAAFAWGVDIDVRAVRVSSDNAERNAVARSYRAFDPQSLPAHLVVDIVVANILAQPLLELTPILSRLVAPSGHLVLSGLLAQQIDLVRASYDQEFSLQARLHEDENHRQLWAMLVGQRRSAEPR